MAMFIRESRRNAGRSTYKQINSLFHNEGNGKFVGSDVQLRRGFHDRRTWDAAPPLPISTMTAMSTCSWGTTAILRCCFATAAATGNHFVNLNLVGTKSNRDAMGARVKLDAGGITQLREIAGGGSYLSQSDLRAHFGLGAGDACGNDRGRMAQRAEAGF